MHGTAALEKPATEAPPSKDIGEAGGPGRLLAAVFRTFDRAGIPYCVLHGYEGFPQRIGSDVDCIIDRHVRLDEVVRLLARDGAALGAEVVRCKGSHIVLAGRDGEAAAYFLTLDLSTDCELDGVRCYDGGEVLEGRRRRDCFWIPAAALEFGCCLVRSVAKGRLDEERAEKLSSLFRQDAAGCERQAARFWGRRNAALLISAARSGDWAPVRQRLGKLGAELRGLAILRRPGRFALRRLRGLAQRARRGLRPDGVYLAVLGPDGAGKSSLIEALGLRLSGVFARSTCYGFTPAVIHRLRHGPYRENSAPHALPPRSYLASVARAVCYWFVYYTLGYLVRHLDLARSTLVLSDRHFADVLVDPRRYRYGGPMWLVRLIWRVIPKPDIVVLLDAPPEVLQARKQDVPFDETARQRAAYLSLVRTMANGRVVDVDRPLDDVAADVGDIVLRHLRARIASRFGVEQNVL